MTSTVLRPSRLEQIAVRWGRHYIWRISLFFQITSFLAASLGIFYIVLNANLNEVQYARLANAVFGLVAIANILVFIYGYRISAQARARMDAWAQAKKTNTLIEPAAEQEEPAWREVTAYPWRFTRFSVLISFFQVIVPAVVYMRLAAGFSFLQAIHAVIGGAISASGLLLFYFFALEWALQPARQALLPHAPEQQHSGLGGAGVQSRLLLVFVSVEMTALLMVAALAYQKAFDMTLPGVDAAATLRSLQIQLGVVGFTALLFAAAFSYLLARSVSAPINHLTQVMTEVEGGHLNRRAEATGTDEIGHLVIAFNSMVTQLENLHTKMEDRVRVRTQELEQKTKQLRSSTSVARMIAEIQDIPELMNAVTALTAERFELDHVGLFLLNEGKKIAFLQAASSQTGRDLIARGYSVSLESRSAITAVVEQRRPYVKSESAEGSLGSDVGFPRARSRMILPLITRGSLIGVMDFLSEQQQVFGPEDAEILQSLADLVAISIENVRLLNETRALVSQLETLTSIQSQETWLKFSRHRTPSYQYTPAGIRPTPASPVKHDPAGLQIPLSLRGQTIGKITLRRKDNALAWTDRERGMVETISDQISLALDNSRLVEEAQKNAQRDQLIANVSSRVRETLDVDAVIKTAAVELRRIFDLKEAEVSLGALAPVTPPDGKPPRRARSN